MNIIDNIIRGVAPIHAEKRMRSRLELQRLDMISQVVNSGYSEGGASRHKTSLKGWKSSSERPQRDIDENLSVLRERSRNLIMNAPIARSAVNTKRTNCIGSGLKVKSNIDYKYLGISKEEAADIQTKIEREFNFWASSKKCDSSCQNNFYELQQIAFSSWMANGEAFAFPMYGESTFWNPYSLKIKLIEADRISDPESFGDYVFYSEKRNPKNGNKIYNGVEIDESGKVAAYYVCNGYKNDNNVKKWIRVEAYGEKTGNPNVLHIFEAERAESYRGVPMLAPVIESIKQLTRYSEAEIMAAVINGIFTVMIKSDEGIAGANFTGEDEDTETYGDTSIDEDDDIELSNGNVAFLKPGESVEVVDAKRPNVNFDAFTSSMCKYIGAALEIPKDLLLKEFNKSYSASRAALMEAWKSFSMWRSWFISDFCQPVYELFLSEAAATGRIDLPGFFLDPMIRHAYCKATWSGPAAGQLDPVKEANGAILRIKNGLSTRSRECIEINGSDFDENISQLESENEKMKNAFKTLEESEV